MGVLIPTEVLSRLHIINDMPVSEDLKRGRFGDALKDVGGDKAQILRLLIALLTEYVFCGRELTIVALSVVLMICQCRRKRSVGLHQC